MFVTKSCKDHPRVKFKCEWPQVVPNLAAINFWIAGSRRSYDKPPTSTGLYSSHAALPQADHPTN